MVFRGSGWIWKSEEIKRECNGYLWEEQVGQKYSEIIRIKHECNRYLWEEQNKWNKIFRDIRRISFLNKSFNSFKLDWHTTCQEILPTKTQPENMCWTSWLKNQEQKASEHKSQTNNKKISCLASHIFTVALDASRQWNLLQFKREGKGLPWPFKVKTVLPMQRTLVQLLVRELRSLHAVWPKD